MEALRDAFDFRDFSKPERIGFAIFTAYPMIASFIYSFSIYHSKRPLEWVGLQNYATMLTDDLFWKALWNTIYMVGIGVPLTLFASFLCAVLLNLKVKGQAFYRVIYFLPSIVPTVAGTILWIWLLQPQFGLINAMLRYVGVRGPEWLQDPAWALPAFILMSLWGIGGGRMIIFLAGLQGIPDSYYEAAEIDGAGAWSKFRHITLPMLTPVIFFNMVLGVVGSFQVFTAAYIMTGGGPADATLFYVLYLFRQAFEEFRMGYASAMAWILFLILLAFTAVQFWQSKRWVYYESELR